MKVNMYDMEGARLGAAELEVVFPTYVVLVLGRNGLWGKRTFEYRQGDYVQTGPVEWSNPPPRYTAADNIRLIQEDALSKD